MGLKIGEAFKDRCYLTVLATGAPATLLADVTCVEIDQLGNRAPLVVAEESDGWYTTSFTPDAAGTWATEWSKTLVPENYVFHYPYKEFMVGGGQEADIITDVAATHAHAAGAEADIAAVHLHTADILADTNELQTDWVNGGRLDLLVDAIKTKTDNLPADPADDSDIKALHTVPVKDVVTNTNMRDVLGNKTDTPKWFFTDTQSAMALLKGAVHSGGGISYAGTCDAGMGASTTIIVCAQLAGFGDDFFNTDYVLKVALNDNSHGASPEADAARDITDYDTATGTFTTAAFNNNVEANDKIVVSKRSFYALDQIALLAAPGTNSLAYRLSQFVAAGDGDFGGTALPADISLYDVLHGANGIPVWSAAAAPANGVSMAEVLRAVYDDSNELQTDLVNGGRLDLLIDAIKARTDHHLITRTFFSPSQISVTVTNGAGDKALPTVTLPNITGTIVHAYAGFKFRMIENTNAAANKLSGAQEIQIQAAAEGWADCIHFVDDQFGVAASTREGGDCIIGYTDVVGTVDVFNDTYEFQWDEAVADQSNLVFNDVQTFVIISYY